MQVLLTPLFPTCYGVLLAPLTSTYNQNLTTSHYLHCYHPGSINYRLPFEVFQQPFNKSLSIHSDCLPTIFSRAARVVLSNIYVSFSYPSASNSSVAPYFTQNKTKVLTINYKVNMNLALIISLNSVFTTLPLSYSILAILASFLFLGQPYFRALALAIPFA